MPKRTKREIMTGVDSTESRVIDNNTIRYTDLIGNTVIRLHFTDIITITPDGDVILHSGGWKTNVTKDRMCRYQSIAQVVQAKSIWYVKSRLSYDESIFYDGITIKANGKILKPERVSETPKIIKMIKEYCKKLGGLDKFPQPNKGDCWDCSLTDIDGKTMGHGSPGHLMSHLREKYIHGSLIVNAMRDAGYKDEAIGMALRGSWFPKDSVVMAVSRYFKVQLGIPR